MATFLLEMRITEQDLANIPDDEFPDFWETLGKVVRVVLVARRTRLEKEKADAST